MTTMHFKDEGGTDENPFGPVTIIDHDAYATWREQQGIGPGTLGIPYGSKPAGIEDLGWQHLSWARAEAQRRGVTLVES